MVSPAIVRHLLATRLTPESLILRNYEELDLTDQSAVLAFFEGEKPDLAYLAAAKVDRIYSIIPPGRIHLPKPDDPGQRHQRRISQWCREVAVLGLQLHLA
jgi:hypothetical protein